MTGSKLSCSSINRHVAARIRERRSELGLFQQDFAESLGVSQQAISKIESGSATISAGVLWSIANALATPAEFYFEGLVGHQVRGPGEGA